MAAYFRTFQQFNDPGLASAIAEKLEAQQIECVVEKVVPLLEPSFFRNPVEQTIHLKVRASDLDEAHKALEEYYKHHLQDVDTGYYLFSFSDPELLEIVAKPDEWGHFDYVLARALLADRGLEIPDEIVEQMKQQRLRQLAKNDSLYQPVDPLVAFGTLLDGFFDGVRKGMRKALHKANSFFNEH
jgi:hypothetical protein